MSIQRPLNSSESCVNALYDLMIKYGVEVFLASLKEALCIWKAKISDFVNLKGGM